MCATAVGAWRRQLLQKPSFLLCRFTRRSLPLASLLPNWRGAGFWRGLEWQLHLSECCPTQLRRYVSVAPSSRATKAKCASGLPTSLPSCTERMALLDELRNSSILMLGDSTSAQLLMHSCDAFSSSPKSFVAVPQDVDLGKYHHGACDRSTTTRADCSGTAPEAASPSAPFRTLA